MSKISIIIPTVVVDNIQLKNAELTVLTNVMREFVETHLQDTVGTALQSPVYNALQEKATNAMIAFEKAKDDMVKTYIDLPSGKVANWELNYNNCTLSYETTETA